MKKMTAVISVRQPEEIRTGGGDPGDGASPYAWRDNFQTDPSVSQVVLELSKAKAKLCPLYLQLNKPDSRHTYIKRFDQW